MSRETRNNLIFLALILAVMIPPAVILFRKKLDPNARIMYLPDPVPHAVAYMVPGPTPPGLSRVVPPRTEAWLQQLPAAESSPALQLPRDPLMSERATFQVLLIQQHGQQLEVRVLHWVTPPPDVTWLLRTDRQEVTGQVQQRQMVPVPNDVRQELGEHGLLRPPKELAFETVRFAIAPASANRLVFAGQAVTGDVDSVPLFTNSVLPSEYKKIP